VKMRLSSTVKAFSQEISFGNVGRRIALSFGGVILLLMVIVLLAGGYYFRGVMEREQDKLSTLVTSILSSSVSRISFSGKYHARLLLEEIRAEQPGILYLMVVNPDGYILAHSDPAMDDRRLDETDMASVRAVMHGKKRDIRELSVDGKRVRDITLPYRDDLEGKVKGVIRVGLSDEERISSLERGYVFILALAVLLLLAGVVASFWIGNYFGRPVKRLAWNMAATIKAIPDQLFELDEEGRYFNVQANRDGLPMVDGAPLLGRTVKEALPSEAADTLLQALGDAAKNGVSRGAQIHFPSPQGGTWFELSIAARETMPGEGRRFIVLSRDITERKRTEEALQSLNLDFVTFLENTSDFIYFKDEHSRLRFCSQTLATITGHTSWRDMIGKHDLEIFPAETAKIYQEEELPVFRDGKPLLNKVDPYYDAQGDLRWVNTSKWPLIDSESGKVVGLFGISRDVTEQKRAEEALQRLNDTLAEKVKAEVEKNMAQERLLIQQSRLAAMGEMVHNIAHQWRQPINTLGIILANLKDAYEYKELDGAYLDKAVDNANRLIQRMSTTIDDFRNFFKPNREMERFDVRESVAEAIRLIHDSFRHHAIEISVEQPEGGLTGIGYPNEFAQVVLNIIDNAKDAILARDVQGGRIGLRLSSDGKRAVVAVRDNGGGVPEEILGKVFDPYFTTRDKGSGIGLYMSKMIMEKMDGEISLANCEGGTEVLLRLPLAQAGEAEA